MCTVQKKTEAMLVASKAMGLEVTAEKPKYMVMPRENSAKKYIAPSRELINSLNVCQKAKNFGNDTKNDNCVYE